MTTSVIPFLPPPVPRDSEGYVKAFTLSNCDHPEVREASEFFDEFGFVVIANVFTSEQCVDTISDIWNVIESFVGQPVRNDEKLWTPEYILLHVLFFHMFFLNMRFIVLDIGEKQDLSKKVSLVAQAFGLGKFCLIVRLRLCMRPLLLFLEWRTYW
jgi:hypothetical protein